MTNAPLTKEEILEWDTLLEIFRRTSGSQWIRDIGWDKIIQRIKRQNISFANSWGQGKSLKNSLDGVNNTSAWIKNIATVYKNADNIYDKVTQSSTLKPDDDIYIDCKPVDTFGEEITAENNLVETNNKSLEILDELTRNVNGGAWFDNIGFQTVMGIALLGILYSIGNYVFIKFPKKIINKDV